MPPSSSMFSQGRNHLIRHAIGSVNRGQEALGGASCIQKVAPGDRNGNPLDRANCIVQIVDEAVSIITFVFLVLSYDVTISSPGTFRWLRVLPVDSSKNNNSDLPEN
jgi:hypothetical protein